MTFLLDTSIISELRKPLKCRNRGLQKWFDWAASADLFLSALVISEIRKGIEAKRDTDISQAHALEAWLANLASAYADRILPVSVAVAGFWGRAQAIRRFPIIDGLMAATAQEHGMQPVTRNVSDLKDWPHSGLLLNPFD